MLYRHSAHMLWNVYDDKRRAIYILIRTLSSRKILLFSIVFGAFTHTTAELRNKIYNKPRLYRMYDRRSAIKECHQMINEMEIIAQSTYSGKHGNLVNLVFLFQLQRIWSP